MLSVLWQDIRYGARSLRHSPGFAAVAAISLALGAGANTAIFSLIDAVMLKTLPVSHPEELLQVTMATPQFFSNPQWEAIRDRADGFAGLMAYGRWAINLSSGGEVRDADGQFVSGQYFETLRVRPAVGRLLTPADDWRGCPGAAVLSYGFWQREYGGRRDAVGRTILLDGHPIEIAGVADRGFTGVDVGAKVDVLVPLCAERILHGESSGLDKNGLPGTGGFLYSWLRVIGRAKPGTSPGQMTARLEALAPAVFQATLPRFWGADEQERYLHRTLAAEPIPTGLSYFRDQYRQPLLILMAVVGMVLLIACANVANLLLARGAARQKEIAIRLAVGAGRGRLVRQFLTESLLLSGAGTLLGVVFARWATRLLVVYLDVPLDLRPDVRVFAFTAAVAAGAGLLFGLAPAWHAARVPPQASMKANALGAGADGRIATGTMLVSAQIALSMVLVVGAGLLLSTFWKLASVDAGFDREGVLLAGVDLRPAGIAPAGHAATFAAILEKVRAIPGVRAAAAAQTPPLCGCLSPFEMAVEGAADVTVTKSTVSTGYFQAMGIVLRAGRDFDGRDTASAPAVAIVSQALAERVFPGSNPVGRHYRVRRANGLSAPVEIVGVAGNAKYAALRERLHLVVYLPRTQDATANPQTNLVVRAAAQPAALAGPVKAAVAEVNRKVSLEFTTLADKAGRSLERERLLAALSGFFGALALLLASVGLYGVMSYRVARRRHEIGIRMALGAAPAAVRRMVLGEIARVTAAGLALGLGLSMATTRFVSSLLYGLQPNDPLTLCLAAAVLGAAAIAAGYLPARRASRLDPMPALREE